MRELVRCVVLQIIPSLTPPYRYRITSIWNPPVSKQYTAHCLRLRPVIVSVIVPISRRRLYRADRPTVTRRTAASISDIPRTPVRSLRCALQPTINITDVVRACADRNLYLVPSYFGTNPCDPLDHLSRHLVVVGGDRVGLSRPLVPSTGSVRIIRPTGRHTAGPCSALGASSSPREHLFSARHTGIWPSPAICRRRWRWLSTTGLESIVAICYHAVWRCGGYGMAWNGTSRQSIALTAQSTKWHFSRFKNSKLLSQCFLGDWRNICSLHVFKQSHRCRLLTTFMGAQLSPFLTLISSLYSLSSFFPLHLFILPCRVWWSSYAP